MPLPVAFIGGDDGVWEVVSAAAVTGEGLPGASRLRVVEGPAPNAEADGVAWVLRGVTSNERYVTRGEHDALAALQEPLGRPTSRCAALIPITKSEAWWDLPQDERRRIFEESSHHVATGMRYLPAVARRLHHGRDLGEPFDFLTWFEFSATASDAFDELVAILRTTEEWSFVTREVDIRLVRS
jgi:chlorite dismutase